VKKALYFLWAACAVAILATVVVSIVKTGFWALAFIGIMFGAMGIVGCMAVGMVFVTDLLLARAESHAQQKESKQ